MSDASDGYRRMSFEEKRAHAAARRPAAPLVACPKCPTRLLERELGAHLARAHGGR